MLLRADGTKMQEFLGLVHEGVLKQALEELASERSQ